MRDALPNASFIGFTGTPIELADTNTRAVFGDYIDVYDIQRAVEDGATVPIYYESRLAKLELDEAEQPEDRPGVRGGHRGRGGRAQGEAQDASGRSWRRMVGAEKRLELIAAGHRRAFRAAAGGDGRQGDDRLHEPAHLRGAVRRRSSKLRPEWHSDDDDDGRDQGRDDRLGVRSARLAAAHPQQGRGARRWPSASRTPNDPFKIVIVRDMWLTGFDAPCLHTMYVDKPMRGHGLMQAIARVNRVFKDKPGGLVVDYLGLADELKQALADLHRERRHAARRRIDQDEAVARACWRSTRSAAACSTASTGRRGRRARPQERLGLLPAAQEHILAQEDGKDRLPAGGARAVAGVRAGGAARRGAAHPRRRRRSSRPCGRCSPSARPATARPDEDLDHAIRQIVSRAVASGRGDRHLRRRRAEEAGHLDPVREFLAEVRGMPQRNLAVELLRKLLNDEIKMRGREEPRPGALVRRDAGASHPPLPEPRHRGRAGHRGTDRSWPRRCARPTQRGEDLGLTEDEMAFYDALEVNDSAVQGARRRHLADHRPRTGRRPSAAT